MEAVEQFLRFADLKNLKICQSYPQLRNLQKHCGFPVGVLISPNCRIFAACEVNSWLASRPTNPKPQPGQRKQSAQAA